MHPDPDVDAQIKQLIDSELAKRSLIKTDSEGADLYVDYQTAISKATKWETYEDWTSAGLMDGRIPQRREVTIDVGTLIVDLYDAPEKRLVWSGHATKTLDPKSSREQRTRISTRRRKTSSRITRRNNLRTPGTALSRRKR